ncbi:hypothetical protein GCHA_2548 [Paraglaciecola chathamensis S18K6]|uniref:Uncharacterized protein n=1 Tax=Paraglaciecola chathamensis S18K6 TaxID=1127672 RepID=A0AAV3V141_9ALTE|nr:hypothetical protein GCHA_2548 [Paraglaciecola chathamensis S18K6]
MKKLIVVFTALALKFKYVQAVYSPVVTHVYVFVFNRFNDFHAY